MTNDDLPEPSLNLIPTPAWSGLEAPFDQNIRLLLLQAALEDTLSLQSPNVSEGMASPMAWSNEQLQNFVTADLTVADLQALARGLNAELELTFRFPQNAQISVPL